jgi:hypothetical protein
VRSFPGSTYDGAEVPVNPADGQVIERTFDPYLLGEEARAAGVRRQGERPHGQRQRSNGAPSCQRTSLSYVPVTIYSAREFVIAAKKT